jgi:glycosyltransferase involved in cell wall biosynthesis
MSALAVQLVLVDSASSDGTLQVMREFRAASYSDTLIIHVRRPGQHAAQDAAWRHCRGDLIVFTDDDCYLKDDYFRVLSEHFDPAQFQYGSGEIELYDPADDPNVASTLWWRLDDQLTILPAGVPPIPGAVQGSNMFFTRALLERIGGVKNFLGWGSDAATAAEAAFAGFTGVQIKGLVVQHHHGKRRGSPEALATLERYARTRGAYAVYLSMKGINPPWSGIRRLASGSGRSRVSLLLLQRELEGAAEYLAALRGTAAAHAAAPPS